MIVVEMVLAPCQGTHFNVLHLQDTVQIFQAIQRLFEADVRTVRIRRILRRITPFLR